jgi:hypothetical protein
MEKAWLREGLVASLLTIAAILPAHSQPPGAAFLDISPSPRAYALGGTDGVTSVGAQALDANPANLGLKGEKYQVFTAYQKLLDGTDYGHIAAAASPLFLADVVDAVGVSVTRLSVGGLAGADASGNLTGTTFSASDMATTLGASRRIGQNLRLGLDLKIIQSSIGSYNSNVALGADLGATYVMTQFENKPMASVGVTNAGQGLKFLSQTDPLPTTVNLGAAIPLKPSLVVMAEVSRSLYAQTTRVSGGVEWSVGPAALRAGYFGVLGAPANLALQDSGRTQQILGGLTAGVGVHWGGFGFDYAMSTQAADYGTTQRASVSFAWGMADSNPKAVSRLAAAEKNDRRWDDGPGGLILMGY